MPIFLTNLGIKVWGKVAAVGGIILAFFVVYLKGKSAAKDEIHQETVETIIETQKKVRENEKDIRDLGSIDDPKRVSLRKKYYRD